MMAATPIESYIERAKSRDAPSEAERRRNEGMESVASNNKEWLAKCLAHLRQIAMYGSPSWANLESGFPGETVRKIMEAAGLIPTKPQAWGALCQQAERQNIIRKTGRYVAMQDPKSNARATAEYVFVRAE